METDFRSPEVEGRSGLASRIVHGPTSKLAFDVTMNLLARMSPRFSYSLRTSLREAAFPLRPAKKDTAPNLRKDLGVYADLYRAASRNFEEVVSPYQLEIRWPRARVFNGFFETIDAELYYCIVRFFRPRRIIEVGAGNSTWFARDALKKNRGGKLSAIDPAPRLFLPNECELVRRLVQDAEITAFRDLRENDILFIDSSHTEDEAKFLVENIYPILQPGVFIHHHDILFPFLGYTSFEPPWEEFGEQGVVLEFLRQHTGSYNVFTSSAFVHYESPSMVRDLIPSKAYKPAVAGGSLWIRKRG